MKRNLLALAVGVAFVLPLAAQAAPTVYGRLNLSIDYTKMTDKTVSPSVKDSNWELNSNASRVGVKGNEKLTDEFTAVYKAEWEVNGDHGGADLLGRERYIGLKHYQLGTVRLGNIDSPFKNAEDSIDVFNDYVHLDMTNVLSGQNRLANSINYVSPKFLDVFGANVTLQPGESHKNPAGNSKNHLADAYSAAFSYEDDSLYLSAAFDKKVMSSLPASTGLAAAPRDATRLGARYKMNDLTLSAMFQKSKLATPTAVPGDKADESAMMLSGSYAMDKLTFRGEVVMNTLKGVPAGGATPKDKISLMGVGVDYNFTPATKVFGNLAARKDKYTGTGADGSVNESLIGVGMETRF